MSKRSPVIFTSIYTIALSFLHRNFYVESVILHGNLGGADLGIHKAFVMIEDAQTVNVRIQHVPLKNSSVGKPGKNHHFLFGFHDAPEFPCGKVLVPGKADLSYEDLTVLIDREGDDSFPGILWESRWTT